MAEYRIVRDRFLGYEVQVRNWFWPFWRQAGYCNTHVSLERAEEYANRFASNKKLVKKLGML